MGLGKTLQTISLIAYLKVERKLKGPSLVVCPLSVLSAWCTEFATWAPSLRVVKLHAVDVRERERRAKALITELGSYDVVVTTYEMLKNPAMKSTLVQRMHWRCFVIDEGHVIKNPNTNLSQTCRKVHYHFGLLLTGTESHATTSPASRIRASHAPCKSRWK